MTNRSKYWYFVVLACTLSWSACQNDEDCPPDAERGNMRITFAALFDGVPITDSGIYTNIENYRIDPSQLRIHIGDISLMSNGSASLVSDIELVDLLDGEEVRNYEVAPAAFDGLEFGIGVPADLNNTDPVTFGPDHPLYLQNGAYWTWTTGYRFVLFEGIADTTGTGAGPFDIVYSMHPGLDTAYREVQYTAPISISNDATTDIRVEFDVSRFFYSTTDTLHLNTENQLHGNNSFLNNKLADLIQASVTVSQ